MSLNLGDQINLTIHDVAFGGEGVGRIEEFVIFVPFVITGETVAAEITEVKKNFARAKLLRVITPSPERVEPPCRYYGACGGCRKRWSRNQIPAPNTTKYTSAKAASEAVTAGAAIGATLSAVRSSP